MNNIDLIHMNLTELLDDICEFLKDGVNKEALNPEARKIADNLIIRSTVQLQHISALLNTEEYEQVEVGQLETRPPQPNIPIQKEVTFDDIDECPHKELPAKQLPNEDKRGYILVKSRFMVYWEKVRKMYAGIIDHWLLIYKNEKCNKPLQTFNLKIHKARSLPSDIETEDSVVCFCIVNIKTKEAYQFVAQTNKDLKQWIVRINKCTEIIASVYPPKIDATVTVSIPKKYSPEMNTTDNDENVEREIYDEIFSNELPEELNSEEENIYEDLGYYSVGVETTPQNKVPPKILPKPQLIKQRLLPEKPVLTVTPFQKESVEFKESTPEMTNTDSFSSENELSDEDIEYSSVYTAPSKQELVAPPILQAATKPTSPRKIPVNVKMKKVLQLVKESTAM